LYLYDISRKYKSSYHTFENRAWFFFIGYHNNSQCFQAQRLIAYATNQSIHYRTNNIILTMGDDFQYADAAVNFYSMDKLIKLV